MSSEFMKKYPKSRECKFCGRCCSNKGIKQHEKGCIQRTIAKLNDYQIKEIRKCNSKGYRRLSNDYERQFAEWKKLERLGVGYADGLGEVEEYWLHDFGKHIKKSLAACE